MTATVNGREGAELSPKLPREVGWIGLCVVAAGVTLVVIALTQAIWFAFPQPSAPMAFAGLPYSFPDPRGLEADYLGNLPWTLLLVAGLVATVSCFPHRFRRTIQASALTIGLVAAALTLVAVHDLGVTYHAGDYVASGPYLATAGYLVIGLGGVIGGLEVRQASILWGWVW